jgi:hypothetical protein
MSSHGNWSGQIRFDSREASGGNQPLECPSFFGQFAGLERDQGSVAFWRPLSGIDRSIT